MLFKFICFIATMINYLFIISLDLSFAITIELMVLALIFWVLLCYIAEGVCCRKGIGYAHTYL